MILTILAVSVLFLGCVFMLIDHLREGYQQDWAIPGGILLILGGIFCGCCLGAHSFKEVLASREIARFEAVRQTIIVARENKNVTDYELAAIQHKAVEKNEWLANARFWTEHPLTNWFWSKRILEIEPIK